MRRARSPPRRGRSRSRSRSASPHGERNEELETFDYTALLSVAPQREERSSAPVETNEVAHSLMGGAHRFSKTLDQRLDGLREHFLPGGVLGGMLMKEESQGEGARGK